VPAVQPPLLAAIAVGANVTVVALFSSPRAANLNCVAIDARSGEVLRSQPVTGPAATYFSALYGAETRVYPYRPTAHRFVFADIVQSGASATSPITLYSIDATTCASSAQVLSGGATGFVVSFAYHPETDALVLATGAKDGATFDFWAVNLDTATAAHLANVPRGASEASSPAFYAPYLSALDLNGTSALRLGYQAVTSGTGPGLGVTPLGATAGGAAWELVPSVPNQEAPFYSLTRPFGGDAFVSLSPSAAANHTLSVVAWARANSPNAKSWRVLLDLPNAHPPGSTLQGVLGYVADVATLDLYAALVVSKGPKSSPLGAQDTWSLAVVNLTDGSASSVLLRPGTTAFDPLGAETVSVSGVGILASA
jgi:hypothetical protein